MSDDEWLLQELDRWSDPAYCGETRAQVRAAVASPAHQLLGTRLRAAIRTAPARSIDRGLPAPC
ncbi:hypothetical protein [Longimicrobium terrae]|uniref:Uncharacterized protein n=1 Tax=Longimicrobium terrae TaxID=1639882 RepID=A0A841GSR8_9BACT|nr:hypothetical protein [Longimicrobium terrae]MBB4635954.1 hypothetical protein [Longimicrobium terrae]MBB6070350.1 hypothetical protein [Longimicrobium terrae]NNC30847.1 hypothetical protein [Longimicrobium terrae]